MEIKLSFQEVETFVVVALDKRPEVTYKRESFENPVKVIYTVSFNNSSVKPFKIQIYPLEKRTEITFPIIIAQTEVLRFPGRILEIFDGEELPQYDDPIDKAKYDVCHSIYCELAVNESIKEEPLTQKRENGIPSMEDIDTSVGESLSCLKKPDYKVEREQFGKNIHYSVYKNGVFVGVYRIKPGEPGGSIQCTDDIELYKEWMVILEQLIWGDLQRLFGDFPWSNEQPTTGNMGAAKLDKTVNSREGTFDPHRPAGFEILADNIGGTAIYKRNEEGVIGNVIPMANPGWAFEVGQKSISLKPEDVTISAGAIEPMAKTPKSQDIRIAKRRAKVRELSEKGEPIENIARNIGISIATVVRDRKFLGIATSRDKYKT
jgi:hypothetical protein